MLVYNAGYGCVTSSVSMVVHDYCSALLDIDALSILF